MAIPLLVVTAAAMAASLAFLLVTALASTSSLSRHGVRLIVTAERSRSVHGARLKVETATTTASETLLLIAAGALAGSRSSRRVSQGREGVGSLAVMNER